MSELLISKYCQINQNSIYVDGEKINLSTNESLDSFIRQLYKNLNQAYPKFYKMDELCKLALIASDYLLLNHDLTTKYASDEIAVWLQNSHSSACSDDKHLESIRANKEYFPSPSVFVYTLANIMIGEICIKHQITGENNCTIVQKPNYDILVEDIEVLFKSTDTKSCIAGYVDFYQGNYQALLFLIERKQGSEVPNFGTFNKKNIQKRINRNG